MSPPRASWRLPGASHSVQERTRGLQECPRASWSILEASRNVFQAFPGRSRVTKNTIFVDPNLLNDSENFVVSMKFFKASWSALEASRSVPERLRNVQECLRAPSSGLLAPHKMSQSVPECLTGSLQMASKISGTCLGRFYNGPGCPNVCTWLASRVLLTPLCFPLIFVIIIPMTSIANGVTVAVLSICVPSWLFRLGFA